MPFRKFRTSLLVLIAFGAVSSRQVEGHSRDDIGRLKDLTTMTRTGSSNKGQALCHAFVAVRYPAQQRGSITGQVVLPSGHQVSNRIRITLIGFRTSPLTAFTDNKGRFIFPSVNDGMYTVEVEGDSSLYEPVTQEVRVIHGAAPALLINLKEKPGTVRKSMPSVVSAAELDQQVPEAARKEYEKGVEFSGQRKIQDSIERLKRAIDIFPTYLMARNNLGVQYLKLGQWEEAAEQFEAAIEINSKALNPRQNLALALIEQKKYAQAIEHLNQAISIDSSSPTTHLYAGIASLGIDEIDQAERELSAALSMGGAEYSNAHFYLALVYMKKGERGPAIRELKAYLEKLPKGEKAPRARQLLEKLKP